MKYAIVESGGKQYKAVEGETIEVDRLPVNPGENIDLERVLMMVDGDDISVGTPTVDGIQVSATVVDHFRGPKLIVFKYRPKNRIRVKGGHRQQYTRLKVMAINAGGKAVKPKKAETPVTEKVEAEIKVEKKESTVKKAAEKKPEKVSAKKETEKKAEKAPAKKTTAKKTTEKASSTKKTEK